MKFCCSLPIPFACQSSLLAIVLAIVLALGTTASAQTIVRYGEPAVAGTITSTNQTNRYILLGAQQGDTLRITFSSQYSGYPSYAYHHRLDVSEGTNAVGGGIDGRGTLTTRLGATAIYTINVRARNNTSTGWYAFQIDRLNDPVNAERIAFDWNMRDSIASTAGFKTYTLSAAAGGTALLRFTCQYSGYPCYCYHHYAELVNAAGGRVAIVKGNGSTKISLQKNEIYTLFVAAQDFQKTGWFAVSVECQSWPATPCDCTAHSSNYGRGWAGTNGVPTLTSSAPPTLGSTVDFQLGNSFGQQTAALVLIGIDTARQKSAKYGGTLLVAAPMVLGPVTIPSSGGTLPFAIPNIPMLCGIGFAVQSVVVDPGAQPGQLAFSRGMLLLIGN